VLGPLVPFVAAAALTAAGAAAAQESAPADPTARARAEVAAVRAADLIVIAEVRAVHPSPGSWSGRAESRQEFTYTVVEAVVGEAPADGAVRVGHLLVAGARWTREDEAALDPEVFRPAARFLLCLQGGPGDWRLGRPEDGAVRRLEAGGQAALERTVAKKDRGLAKYRAWSRARARGRADEARRLHGEALDALRSAQAEYEAALAPYRDDDGFVKPEYAGYEEDLAEIAVYLVDLAKAGR